MAVDRQRVEARLLYIRSRLAALRSMAAGTDAERFAADPLMPSAARYHLQTAIEVGRAVRGLAPAGCYAPASTAR